MDDSRNDDDPQGGHDVLCWRTPDGVGHRFDDDTYSGGGCEATPSEWATTCGANLEHGVPDLDEPMDCMTCIALTVRRNVRCWRGPDGVGHLLDDEAFVDADGKPQDWNYLDGWLTLCEVIVEDIEGDRNNPVDCMSCLVAEARRAAA